MREPPQPPPTLSGADLVRQVEALWQAGPPPDADALLAAAGLTAPADVAAVLAVDQWQRWQAGAPRAAEDYLARHPAVAADEAAALHLVYGEFLVREELGQAPDPQDYLARFPRYAEVLRRQLDFHQAVERSGPTLVDGGGRAPSPAAPPPSPAPGYDLLEKIGEGGMGVVYKAWQSGLRRVVALKMIGGRAAPSADALARFRIEAEAAARLQHPNIVQVYEVGAESGPPFLAMEYVEGGSLARRLAGGPLPPHEAARLLEVLARAVHYAHERKVVHRDLTPANVLLADGAPKITDFGLAKLLVGGPELTRTQIIMGTPAYLSPEQAGGGARAVGPPTDIYALGAILYECLAARPPFKGLSAVDTLAQVVKQEPVPPRRLQPKVPRDLETVCLKCLAKEPERRYASAADLADDLRRFLAGEPVRARPVGPVGRLRRWARRNPAVAALTTAAALLLVLVAVVCAVAYVQTRGALGREAEALADARNRGDEAVRARDRANRNLYTSLVGQARALRLARVEGYRSHAWELLGQARRLDTPDRDLTGLRLDAVACLGDFVGLDPAVRQDLPEGARAFALRPDGCRLAVALADGSVLLSDLRIGADVARLADPGATITCLAFSPDGGSLLVGHRDGAVKLWRPSGDKGAWAGKPLARVGTELYTVCWTSQGRRLACGLFSDAAVVRDLDAAQDARLPASGATLEGLATFSPGGGLLAVACHTGSAHGVQLWDVAARKPRGFLASELGRAFMLDFSPDGSRIACACTEGVAVFDTATLRRTWFVRCDEPFAVAFSPDGRSLCYCASQDFTARLWSLTSNRERAVLRLPEAGRFLAFDAAGERLLAVAGRALRGWALQTEERRTLAGHDSGVEGIAFSPDGALLVSPSIDRTVKVWDPASGSLLRTLGGFGGLTRVAAFPPDGRLLAVGSADAKALVRFWDVGTWKELPLLGEGLDWVDRSQVAQVWVIAFSPDGSHMAVGGDGVGLTLWRSRNPEAGAEAREPFRLLKRLSDKSVTATQFGPDGRHVAWVDRDAVLHLYDVRARRTKPGPPGPLAWHIRSFAFSPDSRSLLYLDRANRDLKRWRLADGGLETVVPNARLRRSRDTRTNGLLAATADGSWVALSGRSVSVWDVGRGELLLALPEEQTAVYSMAWGRGRLAVGTSDGKLSVWDIAAVRRRLGEIGLDWPAALVSRPAPPPGSRP